MATTHRCVHSAIANEVGLQSMSEVWANGEAQLFVVRLAGSTTRDSGVNLRGIISAVQRHVRLPVLLRDSHLAIVICIHHDALVHGIVLVLDDMDLLTVLVCHESVRVRARIEIAQLCGFIRQNHIWNVTKERGTWLPCILLNRKIKPKYLVPTHGWNRTLLMSRLQ